VPRSITLSPAAEEDLAAVRAWFSQPGSGPRALARRRTIAQAIRDLIRHPSRYPIGDHEGVRERPVQGHRVLYAVVPDTGDDRTAGDVLVLRVFGPGQARDRI
jgi:plasmid stabilization system protein ParE